MFLFLHMFDEVVSCNGVNKCRPTGLNVLPDKCSKNNLLCLTSDQSVTGSFQAFLFGSVAFVHISWWAFSQSEIMQNKPLKAAEALVRLCVFCFLFYCFFRDVLHVGLGCNVTFVFTEMNSISESFIKLLLCTRSLCKEFSSLYSWCIFKQFDFFCCL